MLLAVGTVNAPRCTRSAAPAITAATTPAGQPPRTAQASTGAAAQTTGKVCAPSWTRSMSSSHRDDTIAATETARSTTRTGQLRPAGRAYNRETATVHVAISPRTTQPPTGWAYSSTRRTYTA